MLRVYRRMVLGCSAVVLGLSGLASCATKGFNQGDAEYKEFVNRNLRGSDFGLVPGEFVLTFDDGPGPRTIELVRELERRNMPATFFMVGRNMAARPDVVRAIAESPLLIAANHSMTHTEPLTSSTSFAINEIRQADQILLRHWDGLKFMRPPYGALAGSSARIQGINASSPELAAYIGPVLWDIGGELTGRHSADWACWGQVSIASCQQGYINEMQDRGRGVILLHDVHSQTIDMMIRPGGLLDQIEDNPDWQVVGLDKLGDAELARRFNASPGSGGGGGDNGGIVDRPIFFAHANRGVDANGKPVVFFKFNSPGASSIVFTFDGASPVERQGPLVETLIPFSAPGNRSVRVRANFENGQFAVSTFNFTVAAPIDVAARVVEGGAMALTGSATESKAPHDIASMSRCIDLENLRNNSVFTLYSGSGPLETASASGSSKTAVQRYEVQVSGSPLAVGANLWQVNFMTNDGDETTENPQFKIILDTETGCMEHGIREDSEDKTDTFLKGLYIDCENKIWRGETLSLPQGDFTEDNMSRVVEPQKGWYALHAGPMQDSSPLSPGKRVGEACQSK